METILGSLERISYDIEGNLEATIKITDNGSKQAISNLKKDCKYRFKATELNDRTLEQNRLMWALINEISERTGLENWDVYKEALKRAGVRTESLMTTLNVTEQDMEKQFRAVQKLGIKEITNSDGSKTLARIWIVFMGSSKFATKEMQRMVDILEQMKMRL